MSHAEKILKLVNEAYENGECRIDEDIPADERGDGLATFIRNEIIEVCQGIDDYEDALLNVEFALCRARSQLSDLIDVVNEVEA